MIKIVATITDTTLHMHTGADVERKSFIIDVPTKYIPSRIKEFLEARNSESYIGYETLSLSILDERE